MNAATQRLQALMRAAMAEGLLPINAQLPPQDTRPWPAVLLMALGAWLAALPLLGVVGMLFGDVLMHGAAGPYIVGVLLLAGALVVLRNDGVPLFVEQLAVPALLLGLLSLGFVLFRDLPQALAAVALGLLLLGLGWAVRRAWLRVPLGATAALACVVAVAPLDGDPWRGDAQLRYGLAWQAGVLLWLAALALQQRVLAGAAQARAAAALESLAAGWLLACVGGLAWWAGSSFLVGGVLGGGLVGELGRLATEQGGLLARLPLLQGLSVALALASLLLARRAWPGLQRPWLLAAALILVALAAFMPSLGALLLALAACATGARWRLAAAAGVAVAWVIGAFYYQLAWPLAQKAVVLVLAGALLAALAWWPLRQAAREPHDVAAPPPRWARAGLAVGALLVLLVANVGIWQKETLIAKGQPVFIELAPVDPRSLMQGDYMRLNFRLGIVSADVGLMTTPRPRVVARRDAQGIATVLRLHAEGTAPAADELLIELTPKDGRWTLVSDAWFFREDEAQRWGRARYGEFRVAPDGRALLVGLRGEGLAPL